MKTVELYRIVYLSHATASMTEKMAGDLAALSHQRNTMVAITGLLLFDGERFIQALEGAEADVQATMDRIAADDRHDAIVYLHDGAVDRRYFGDWGMRYRRAPQGCCSTTFLDQVKEETAELNDDDLKAAFIGFAVLSSHRPRGYVCTTPG